MPNETKQSTGPVVIDAGVFAPTPQIPFSYKNVEYKAFTILQVRRGTRNRFACLQDHIKACKSLDEQVDVLVELIAEFVPGIPPDSLRDESWESLINAVLQLGGAGGETGPTRGRKKSSKRASART